MYQGPREKMESFFQFAGYATPAQFNPADHHVTVVNNEFRLHEMSVVEWANKFIEWTKERPKEAVRHDPQNSPKRTTSQLASEAKDKLVTCRSKSSLVVFELTYRYFLNLWFNPGMLGTRVVMYALLAAMVGVLFFNLGDSYDYESIQSRSAVLFYCVAFFIFMSVAVLPFTVTERAIVDKEVCNGYYNPACNMRTSRERR
jgi:hypothetical protein